ncbi:MAG: hypothetical protein QOC93_862 [Actinomycetota bacterium]|jgi:hypothetical protein|nr:hypothetical protein [Actinomycetota bacterium]
MSTPDDRTTTGRGSDLNPGTDHSAHATSEQPGTQAGRCNDGVDYLVCSAFADAADEKDRRRAAALAAVAVATGWLSWPQVASAVDGTATDRRLDGLTPQQTETRFGTALSDVDGTELSALLRAVDEEAVEARCATCDQTVTLTPGAHPDWVHLQYVPDPHVGWRPERDDDAGHHPVPVWRYGPAAMPADRVGADPSTDDFDEVDRDRLWMAGAALLGVAGNLVFHHVADGTWAPATEDPAAMTAEARAVLDRLEAAVADARTELDAITRLTRARAAHRHARQTTQGRGEKP